MKLSTLLLGAAISLGGLLSGSAMAHGDEGRGYGWGDHGWRGAYQERHRGYPRHHGHHHKHRHEYYVYRPRPRAYWAPPRHSDGWYGIQLFLGGDL